MRAMLLGGPPACGEVMVLSVHPECKDPVTQD